MHNRSSLIFWLLLMATVCIDAVAFEWAVSDHGPGLAGPVWHTLMVAQLSVVLIWSGLHPEKNIWNRLAVWAAILAALIYQAVMRAVVENVPISRLFNRQEYVWYLPQTVLQAALLLLGLWFLERTRFWNRRSGIVKRWQLSLGDILNITTVVAILAACIHGNYTFYFNDFWGQVGFTVMSAILALACAVTWSLSWHWVLRLAAALAESMLLSVALCYSFWGKLIYQPSINISYFLIQALVISAWLGLAPVLPSPRQTHID